MAKVFEKSSELAIDQSADYEQKVQANEMNPLVSVYEGLLNLGIQSVDHHNQQKYVRITNFISLNSFFACAIYMALAIFWEDWNWFYLVMGMALVCVSVLLQNAFGKVNSSRFTYLLIINWLVCVNALFVGPHAGLTNYFIIAVLIPFLIYDIKDTFMIALGIGLPLIFLYSYEFVSPLFIDYNLPLEQQVILERVGVVMQVLLTILGVYQLVHYSRKTEEELEVSNAQMSLQTAELRRSNSDLEQFAYIISHDLKAPVRNISSFMNLLVNKYGPSLPSEAKEFVGYSHNGAKRLERLIDDILAYSRLGTNLPRPIPVNLNDVVNTIRFEARERLHNSGGTININRDLPVVNNVHSSLMYHVFQNLIINGLKFNKNANPAINVNWTNSLNYYTFTIQDNGIGISKEYSTTIFQMFKRLHTEQEYDGTGIGLAICKKIVEYYHGEIWFESEEGRGTTFYFTVRKF